MRRHNLLAVMALLLAGCSTSKDEMLPAGDSPMLELWNNGASSTHATAESRTTLRRPLAAASARWHSRRATATAAASKTKSGRRFRACLTLTW